MPQEKAKSSWGARPSKKKTEPPSSADQDQFVNGDKGKSARLNVQIPKTLHTRVKVRCAMEERDIKDVVIELLEKRFPE
jgi:hypothetical protein